MTSDSNSGNIVMSNKLKSANQSPETNNTMENFQDGGQNMNSDQNRADFNPNIEGPRMNSNMNSFPQGGGDQRMGDGTMNRMNDNTPNAQMQGYNGGYNQGNFNMGDQHGGPGSDYGPQNNQYNQYNQQNMRPGYPQGPGQPSMPPRPGMGNQNMGAVPPFNSQQQQQQRFMSMSGASIQQQSGPTPTLNKLLTDNGTGQPQPRQNEMTNMPYSSMQQQQQNWGGQRSSMNNPYQQQMQGVRHQQQQQPQGMYDPATQHRVRPNVPASFPQQQYGGQQFPPSSQQQYRMPQNSMQSRPGMGPPPYNQQMSNQYNQQNQMGFSSTSSHNSSQQYNNYQQQQQHHLQQQSPQQQSSQTQGFNSTRPPSQWNGGTSTSSAPTSNTNSNSNSQDSTDLPELSGRLDDLG
ncbi:unnamed protein product, partial [Owenia fusiformis]